MKLRMDFIEKIKPLIHLRLAILARPLLRHPIKKAGREFTQAVCCWAKDTRPIIEQILEDYEISPKTD